MSRLRISRRLIWPLLLAAACTVSCSQPGQTPANEPNAQADGHPAPFQSDANNDPPPSASPTIGPESSPPFHDGLNIPAGTLLTVRLKSPISAESAENNRSFDAVVDGPVAVGGNTLIPRGAAVVGLVESEHTSEVQPDRSNVRLRLESVRVGVADVPIQTASLFARRSSAGDSPSAIWLEKGRRLTFRLREPMSLSSPNAQASH